MSRSLSQKQAEIDPPTAQRLPTTRCIVAKSFNWPESAFRQISVLQANGLARAGHPVSYWLYLRLSFSRPSSGFFAVAAIPAARSFAIRSMSFTGTGLVRGNWTVPFRSS